MMRNVSYQVADLYSSNNISNLKINKFNLSFLLLLYDDYNNNLVSSFNYLNN